jgi:hypothetical protein
VVRSVLARLRETGILRANLLAVFVLAGAVAPVQPTLTAEAAPLDQGFVCNEAGIAGGGVHRCYDFTTEVLTPVPNANAELIHDCGTGWLVIMHGIHRAGSVMPVTFDDFSQNNRVWTVRVHNNGPGVGQFWLTGRCRSA